MGRATEHQWQQSYSRLRDWLIKYHPEVYEEFQRRRGKPGFKFIPVDFSHVKVSELAESSDAYAYNPADPNQGSHP